MLVLGFWVGEGGTLMLWRREVRLSSLEGLIASHSSSDTWLEVSNSRTMASSRARVKPERISSQ